MVCNLNILCFPRAVISREETIFITRYQLWSELASFASAQGAGGEAEAVILGRTGNEIP